MQPGDKITIIEKFEFLDRVREIPHNGSVGCLLSSWDKQNERRQHFFTTALHVAGDDNDKFPVVGRQVYDALKSLEGKIVIKTSSLLDTCLVMIVQGSVGLGADHLPGVLVDGRQVRLTGVWDPSDILQQIKDASSESRLDEIKSRVLKVSHLGASLKEKGRKQIGVFDGEMEPGFLREDTVRLSMKKRATYPGDSGGPVFTQDGSLVGFIRRGAANVVSTDTEVVLAYYVLKELENLTNRGLYFTHDGLLN